MTQIEQMIREEVGAEEKVEIAKSLLKEGSEVDFVAKVTGLAKDAVQNLKNVMK